MGAACSVDEWERADATPEAATEATFLAARFWFRCFSLESLVETLVAKVVVFGICQPVVWQTCLEREIAVISPWSLGNILRVFASCGLVVKIQPVVC